MASMVRRLASLLLAFSLVAPAQRNTGELRLFVVDPSGSPIESTVQLTGQAVGVNRMFTTDTEGRFTAKVLPF
jgi:hypothetical protein